MGDVKSGAGGIAEDQPTAIWNAIWVAIQELGAALAPVVESADTPDWVLSLDDLLADASWKAEEFALRETDNEQP